MMKEICLFYHHLMTVDSRHNEAEMNGEIPVRLIRHVDQTRIVPYSEKGKI
jgi:hypothetical protein